MAKDCPSKSDKGKTKVKKEATSNRIEPEPEYEEVYINTLEVESYAAAKTGRPAMIKPHHAQEGRCS